MNKSIDIWLSKWYYN